MTLQEFNALVAHLNEIAHLIPIRWGSIQNDSTDAKVNMFAYESYQDLNAALEGKPEDTKNYFQKRWYLWKCSQADEYLFYHKPNITKNPVVYDQSWDFEFFGNADWRFDLKGTVIPRALKETGKGVLPDPQTIVNFFYEQQSRGIRNHFQNRLFLIHQPYDWRDENKLRARFEEKQLLITNYCNTLSENEEHQFLEYKGLKADIIYIKEDANGKISASFASSNLN